MEHSSPDCTLQEATGSRGKSLFYGKSLETEAQPAPGQVC